MSIKKDNGTEYIECAGCGRTFDPENSYEVAEWDKHDCETFGNCDTCDEQYELASKDGRCGECGNCAEHCEHDTVTGKISLTADRALDLIADSLRVPSWNIALLGDIADIVASTGRDTIVGGTDE